MVQTEGTMDIWESTILWSNSELEQYFVQRLYWYTQKIGNKIVYC
jgi:hypothetical protein